VGSAVGGLLENGGRFGGVEGGGFGLGVVMHDYWVVAFPLLWPCLACLYCASKVEYLPSMYGRT